MLQNLLYSVEFPLFLAYFYTFTKCICLFAFCVPDYFAVKEDQYRHATKRLVYKKVMYDFWLNMNSICGIATVQYIDDQYWDMML